MQPSNFNIQSAVDLTHGELTHSAIDQFVAKSQELNSLLLDPNQIGAKISELRQTRRISTLAVTKLNEKLNDTASISPVLANLILLGHVAAVESYFRTMFTHLILLDEETQKNCYSKTVSYGAVLFHDKKALPDALLELITFSGKRNIEETLKDYFGIKGKVPTSLDSALEEFNLVCQMRHSIVHKFGIIGINNIRHDVNGNRQLLNKQIRNTFASIQEISQICKNLVNEVNQLLWQQSMTRLIAEFKNNQWKKRNNTVWTWVWKKDKSIYTKYFKLFYSNLIHPHNTNIKDAYDDYEITYNNLPL